MNRGERQAAACKTGNGLKTTVLFSARQGRSLHLDPAKTSEFERVMA